MSRRLQSNLRPNKYMEAVDGPEVMPGLRLTQGMTALLERERAAALRGEGVFPPDPFAAGKLSAFIEWLRAVPPHSVSGLPRYMEAAFEERPDLSSVMPDVPWGELKSYAWWSHLFGRFEVETFRYFGHRMKVRRDVHPEGRITGGTDAIGFFNAEHGIGEAARLLVEALRAAEIPVSTIAYRNTESRQKAIFETEEIGRYRTVIAAINAEMNEPMRNTFGKFFFHDTYVIGQWFWELETAPPWYKPAYKFVDELWAPTRFIEQMLRNEAPKHVHVEYMPLPLRKPRVVENARRADLGLDDRFMFLFTFDFMSVAKRKNPMGLVEAFKKAFAPGEGPQLVLKCINGETRPEKFEALNRATEGRDDITIMNRYLDPDMSAALMNLCGCYVSLHRSEGLGLTIAEAMLLGKPVIATGYSGNLDFMTESTSFMVPWTRVKVGEDAEAYDAEATWAEPDLDAAAEMMRQVYENPESARRMALAGKADLEARFTPEASGARMRERLEKLWQEGK
jgi:glycosyltransferase involved in cell wall biosynthesis